MKGLIRTLVLAGALFVVAGAATVNADVKLTCDQPKCQYNERLGKSQTKSYDLYCKGATSTSQYTYGCHPPKHVTCWPGDYKEYYNCYCTNWSAESAKYVDIDIICNNI